MLTHNRINKNIISFRLFTDFAQFSTLSGGHGRANYDPWWGLLPNRDVRYNDNNYDVQIGRKFRTLDI